MQYSELCTCGGLPECNILYCVHVGGFNTLNCVGGFILEALNTIQSSAFWEPPTVVGTIL